MSKAILILDMPVSCEECIFSSAVGECKFLGDVDESIANGSKDLRCPLKPIPEKRRSYCSGGTHGADANYGWNKCIDEILKKYF